MAWGYRLRVSFTALAKNYRGVRTVPMERDLEKHAREYCEEVIEEVKVYPDPPQGRRRGRNLEFQYNYKRTDRLRESWKPVNTSSGGNISYQVRNYARDPLKHGKYYAGIVHGSPTGGDPRQWHVHGEHGWRTMKDSIEAVGTREEFRARAQYIINKHITNLPL